MPSRPTGTCSVATEPRPPFGSRDAASRDAALEHYDKAIKLNPTSPIALIEYANGLLMLFGDKEEDKAVKLYEKAAKMKAKDAMDVLDIAMANNELED